MNNKYQLRGVKSFRTSVILWILFGAFLHCDGTLSKSNPKKAKKDATPNSAPEIKIKETVFERGLVKEKLKIKELLAHHASPCKACGKTRKFKAGASLAYVTPWNAHGYDVAKTFSQKFTHVSPVWLQLKFLKGLHLQISGTHDIDVDWISTLRQRNKHLKILPRILLDDWSARDYQRAFASEDSMVAVGKSIGDFLTQRNLDGVVLETAWLTPNQRHDLLHLLVHIGDHLRGIHKQFVLVVPPSSPDGAVTFGRNDFEVLKESVDFFSLMTYDYPVRPGPTAPIDWVRKCVEEIVPDDRSDERQKLLVGLNFYGYKYGSYSADAILGSQLVEKLSSEEKYKVTWNGEAMEHKFSRKGEEIYYPSLYSIQKRLEMFEEMNTGLAIWEIGQGLDYFYELL